METCQAWWSSGLAAQEAGQAADFLQHPLHHFPIPCKSRSNPATQWAHFSRHTARSTQAQAPTFSKAMAPPRRPMWHALKFSMGFPVWCGYRAFGSMAEELNLCAGWSEGAFPGQPAGALWLLSCAQLPVVHLESTAPRSLTLLWEC